MATTLCRGGHFYFSGCLVACVLIGDTGGDGEVQIDGGESEGLRGVGRGMGIISGAAVSDVALAESLIGARAVASKADGPFLRKSTEVLLLRYFLRGTSIQCEGNSGPLAFACAVVKAELKWKRQNNVSARSYADELNSSCTWSSGKRTAA